jgi:4-hydroxybenzoate polyprenyltransferase
MTSSDNSGMLNAPFIQRGSWSDYLAICRLDHFIKHIFVIPGIILALILRSSESVFSLRTFLFVMLSVSCSASANYVINEWLDRDFDRNHPHKSGRPCVARKMSPLLVYSEYAILSGLGIVFGFIAGPLTTVAAATLLICGVIYNVPPLRTKDIPFVDVLSESINNPIRLIFGWSMVDQGTLPPASILLAYWMAGAFLMTIKRLAEYREISKSHSVAHLHAYRRSFRFYTEQRLLLSSFGYALVAIFGLSTFLVKYRIEYALMMPLVCFLFCFYFRTGLQPGSAAQAPEKLYRERALMGLVLLLTALFGVLTFVDLPFLDSLMNPHFIKLPFKWQ